MSSTLITALADPDIVFAATQTTPERALEDWSSWSSHWPEVRAEDDRTALARWIRCRVAAVAIDAGIDPADVTIEQLRASASWFAEHLDEYMADAVHELAIELGWQPS